MPDHTLTAAEIALIRSVVYYGAHDHVWKRGTFVSGCSRCEALALLDAVPPAQAERNAALEACAEALGRILGPGGDAHWIGGHADCIRRADAALARLAAARTEAGA